MPEVPLVGLAIKVNTPLYLCKYQCIRVGFTCASAYDIFFELSASAFTQIQGRTVVHFHGQFYAPPVVPRAPENARNFTPGSFDAYKHPCAGEKHLLFVYIRRLAGSQDSGAI